jgi:PTH1 family peptidyl-tRNA hydrolase
MGSSKEIRLICGLGNPGDRYAHTRHNAGFLTVDALAEHVGVSYWKNECGCKLARLACGTSSDGVLLVKPQSYMNTSGGPLSRLMSQEGISAQEILVVHDEVDLPVGSVRIKLGGGLNAHNGLRSVANKLGTRDFARVKCGIGRPLGKMNVSDFVLRQLKGALLAEFERTIQKAAGICELCLEKGASYTAEHVLNDDPTMTNPYVKRSI